MIDSFYSLRVIYLARHPVRQGSEFSSLSNQFQTRMAEIYRVKSKQHYKYKVTYIFPKLIIPHFQ